MGTGRQPAACTTIEGHEVPTEMLPVKLPLTGRSRPYHGQVPKWLLHCPCLCTSLRIDPRSAALALGLFLQCKGCWERESSALCFYNGWLTLPHEMRDSPNIGKGQRPNA